MSDHQYILFTSGQEKHSRGINEMSNENFSKMDKWSSHKLRARLTVLEFSKWSYQAEELKEVRRRLALRSLWYEIFVK